jgi:hypothetical protein
MFQTALGRLGSAVIAPSESLDLHVFIDDENLPTPELNNRFLAGFVAAGLQGAGMSFRRTGGCFRRVDIGGCHVTLDASAKSDEHAGLQYVDILLQVVQRQLPGFTAKGNGTET